ncbi:MAG: tetratricopeptide repeat protein, partial [Pyrinomonadaceae bacterium]
LGHIYYAQSKHSEANIEYRKAIELNPDDPVNKSYLAVSLSKSGNRQEVLKILDELKTQSARQFVPPMAFVNLYIALGEKDEAFAWMEKDFENRSYISLYYTVLPIFNDLHNDPRFTDLVRRVELAKIN